MFADACDWDCSFIRAGCASPGDQSDAARPALDPRLVVAGRARARSSRKPVGRR